MPSTKPATDRISASGRALLEARWSGPVLTSFAQNAEDVRLWRVFGGEAPGFYVDVGAGHPEDYSVTKIFYDAGWSGINVKPGPDCALLAEHRPRDTTLELAISSRAGEAQLWVVPGYSELNSLVRPPARLLPEVAAVQGVPVRTARLDEVVAEHAPGRPVDFLKIDVEGAEREVLESFDPRALRPSVVVVEALSPLTNQPSYEDWELLLLRSGYLFATFDGINRFYVPEERRDLVPVLAYPVSALDRYVRRDLGPRDGEGEDYLPSPGSWMSPREAQELRDALREATETLSAVQRTVSWRVTRPLRAVRRSARRSAERHEHARLSGRFERALAERLDAATRLLAAHGVPGDETAEPRALDSVLEHLRDVLGSCGCSLESAAWLLLTAVDGSYPAPRDVEHATQVLRTSGPEPFVGALRRRITDSGAGSGAGLEIVEGAVVVDVSQIASSDLHTGIQRVARECVSHWLRAGLSIRLSSFDRDAGVLRLLADEESERLRRWQDHLGAEERIGTRVPRASDAILVPWDCDLVVAELPTPEHSAAARGLVQSGVHRSLSFVCYDLIPFVAPESVDPRIVTTFAEYLALLKHGDRVSAISVQTADDLRAFASMLSGQGLRGPQVEAHPLPTEVPPVDLAAAESASTRPEPLVLVVGVHAPRKNHVAVLEAAERLWRQGRRFELLFMGGSAWRAEGYFDAYVERLRREGWPLEVERRVSEAALWNAYRRARFTVFPSLIEGFGLPVAESLAVGTPAITSGYGSMAEIAAGGGALTVDPRDVGDLEAQMRRLLDDDELLERLRVAARSREMGTWSAYARSVWSFFFPAPASW